MACAGGSFLRSCKALWLMKRVLHVVNSMNRGGQETLIMNLYRHIDRSKVQFGFLVTDPSEGDYDKEILGMGGEIFKVEPAEREIRHITPFLQCRKMSKALRKLRKKYDIVHFHNHHAYSSLLELVAAGSAGIRRVILHSHNTSGPNVRVHKLVRPLLKFFNIERLACSKEAADWMFGRGGDGVEIINNAVDREAFAYNPEARARMRAEFGFAEDAKVVLHVGRFNYQKNHRFLLEIFKSMHRRDNRCRLVLVGRGELEDEIRGLVKAGGLEDVVIFAGIRSDIPDLMSGSDLFLFPSLFEGLPVVLVEVQVNGLRCVCSDVISGEVRCSGRIVAQSLESGAEAWSSVALEELDREREAAGEGTGKNFDIEEVARHVQEKYLS